MLGLYHSGEMDHNVNNSPYVICEYSHSPPLGLRFSCLELWLNHRVPMQDCKRVTARQWVS